MRDLFVLKSHLRLWTGVTFQLVCKELFALCKLVQILLLVRLTPLFNFSVIAR